MNNRVIRRRQSGQGMTEYLIILALVGIAAIAVYSFFGQTVRSEMGAISSQLAGQPAKPGLDSAKAASGNANTEGTNQYNLATYNSEDTSLKGGGKGD